MAQEQTVVLNSFAQRIHSQPKPHFLNHHPQIPQMEITLAIKPTSPNSHSTVYKLNKSFWTEGFATDE
jgi:hypothetical protein